MECLQLVLTFTKSIDFGRELFLLLLVVLISGFLKDQFCIFLYLQSCFVPGEIFVLFTYSYVCVCARITSQMFIMALLMYVVLYKLNINKRLRQIFAMRLYFHSLFFSFPSASICQHSPSAQHVPQRRKKEV